VATIKVRSVAVLTPSQRMMASVTGSFRRSSSRDSVPPPEKGSFRLGRRRGSLEGDEIPLWVGLWSVFKPNIASSLATSINLDVDGQLVR
jgi:hypothetical protein